jgi:hypothetical protein
MADQPVKVNVQSRRVDSTILPNTFTEPYRLYVIQQNSDMLNIAGAANGAGELAYEATIKNEQQDSTLADHESRIDSLRVEVDDHEARITSNTVSISAIDTRLTTAEGEILSLHGEVDALQSDALLKSQNLSGLTDVAAARTNLGLGDAAVKNTGTTAGTVAAGDDTRFSTVNGKSGGTINSDTTINGKLNATGITCRDGISGSPSTSVFNINWTSSGQAELWIDAIRIGTINITP